MTVDHCENIYTFSYVNHIVVMSYGQRLKILFC